MSDALQVELVSSERLVWSGEAVMVIARTADGDVGIMRNHAPLLSVMEAGAVEIQTEGERVVVAVDGGFLSNAGNRVSILTEHAELAEDIDLSQARSDLEQAQNASDDDDDNGRERLRNAEARVRAAERAS